MNPKLMINRYLFIAPGLTFINIARSRTIFAHMRTMMQI